MSTALDEYKKYYGIGHDGATVLKHAQLGYFRDSVANTIITPDKLKELGITAEMSREQIIDCLKGQPETFEDDDEKVKLPYRYEIRQIIDFCSVQIAFDDDRKKPVMPKKEDRLTLIDKISYKVDPILDALMRRLFLGHWDKKKKQ